ncbi:hypothetical protein FOL47_007795 [Perkinsus chesapeaki]|uniref:Uncharacterized protein n=1 Tax=Perkinsus chesapeaki TaxID=330153 RepID=A0A7J6LHX8_PERCH|nr:hypothetical protein FOL47_007795 [Perkinsus chesapeaki]
MASSKVPLGPPTSGSEGTVLRYINGQAICQPTGPKAEIQSLLERYLLQKQSAMREQLENNSATTRAVQSAEKLRVEALQVVDHAINTLNLLTNDKWPVGDKTENMQFLQVRATNPERDELDAGRELLDRLERRKDILEDDRKQISLTLSQAASSQVEQCRAFAAVLKGLRDNGEGTKWQMLHRGAVVQVFLFPYDLSVLTRPTSVVRSSELRDATVDNSKGSNKYIAAIYPANSAKGMNVALKFPAGISKEVEGRWRLSAFLLGGVHLMSLSGIPPNPPLLAVLKCGSTQVQSAGVKVAVPPVVPSGLTDRAKCIDLCLKEAQKTIVSMVAFEAMMSDKPIQARHWAWGAGQHNSRPHYSKADATGKVTPQIRTVNLLKSSTVTIALEPLYVILGTPMTPLEELAASQMKHIVLTRLAGSYDPDLSAALVSSPQNATLLDQWLDWLTPLMP